MEAFLSTSLTTKQQEATLEKLPHNSVAQESGRNTLEWLSSMDCHHGVHQSPPIWRPPRALDYKSHQCTPKDLEDASLP